MKFYLDTPENLVVAPQGTSGTTVYGYKVTAISKKHCPVQSYLSVMVLLYLLKLIINSLTRTLFPMLWVMQFTGPTLKVIQPVLV